METFSRETTPPVKNSRTPKPGADERDGRRRRFLPRSPLSGARSAESKGALGRLRPPDAQGRSETRSSPPWRQSQRKRFPVKRGRLSGTRFQDGQSAVALYRQRVGDDFGRGET